MTSPTIESHAHGDRELRGVTSIRTGVVINNCDGLMQGKVLVRIPDLGIEVFARLSASGAGANTGLFDVPRPDDEVLLALDQNDPTNAFVLGGLWSTRSSPPVSAPTDQFHKRIFRTGMTSALGHEVEFDDLDQSLTITTSTEQKVVLAPDSIEVSTTGGTLSIKLDLVTQSISIKAPQSISLEAVGEINLKAGRVSINGTLQTDIQGQLITIN